MNPNTDFIPFARPSYSAEEEEAVVSVIRSGWVTTGAVTAEFEKKVAEAAGVKYSLAVNSATSGLHLALDASGIKAGDYVITSPYTFTATAEVIRYLDAHPLFADIEPETYNISTDRIEELLNRKAAAGSLPSDAAIKAIIPVHVGGELCRRPAILEMAGQKGLAVIEDGAHLQPEPLLTDSESILVYSFYATKCIATGEGGMIITNNAAAADRMRTMRFHGIDREAWDRYRKPGKRAWEYDIIAPGYKYNLPDTASAIGLVQLHKADWMRKKRVEIAALYNESFSGYNFLKTPSFSGGSSRHLYILRIDSDRLTIDRDRMIDELTERGIGTSVHYKPLHLMTYYRNKYGLKPEDFPESLKKYETSFSLPIYPDLTESEISRIIDAVLQIGKKYWRTKQA
ncbi:MAG: DegT/DnrJ/EryC1/StrS aminotransferase family protein [Spirochaetales bacterium]|nr:DegT/DnrJ/EryC1/StrS aminotransferase family protein [Spirochaetales bacterium]